MEADSKKELDKSESSERIKKLKEYVNHLTIDHEKEIIKEPTLKDAHIYCVIHKIPSQQYGLLLEKYIIYSYDLTKNSASKCVGDCICHGENMEIKASLGGSTHNKFNFVQIRLSQNIQTYLFTAFYLTKENVESEGELYLFRIPKKELKELIVKYGGYAHGTFKENGKITMKSLDDEKNKKEYSLRPKIHDPCWTSLMKFRITDNQL